MQRFGCSQRQALRVVRMSASSYLYVARRKDESVLKWPIKEITDTRVHYGFRRVHVMLRREGHMDNVKRVYRLYREEGLSLRLKRPRRNKAAQRRQPKQLAHAINESGACTLWPMRCSMDASCACSRWSICSHGNVWPSMWGKASRARTWCVCSQRSRNAVDLRARSSRTTEASSSRKSWANGPINVGSNSTWAGRHANGERQLGELQWAAASGAPQCHLVHVFGGRQGLTRCTADHLVVESRGSSIRSVARAVCAVPRA